MKAKALYKIILLVSVIVIASCKPEFKNEVIPSKGRADFTRYIAIGNSLTSGFADGGLYLEGQKNSFPEMIANQMKTVGGGDFFTPFFVLNQENGSGYIRLKGFNANGLPVTETVTENLAIRGQISLPQVGAVTLYTKYTAELNNYGIPGIKLTQIENPGYGNANGYFERLLPQASPANTTSYISFVTAKPYTFFSMWLGNNDILGYATAGAAADPPTEKGRFTTIYTSAVNSMTANGAKGVVATIPDVLKVPYFNTVTLQSLLTAVRASAPTVNELYIKPGTGPARLATAADQFILPFGSANLLGVISNGIPYGLSPLNPIENKYVIDQDEAVIINDYVNSYNTTIKSVAASKGLAVMDAYSLLKEYGSGRVVNGETVSGAYITGNLFSLDGIHLTPKGYAIVANEFIKVINKEYGSTIPIVDVSKYRGVKFP